MTEALSLLIGLLVGYFGRQVYDKLSDIHEYWRDKYDAHAAGVVRPTATRVTRNVPIDLSTDSGPVRRPTPQEANTRRLEARDELMHGEG